MAHRKYTCTYVQRIWNPIPYSSIHSVSPWRLTCAIYPRCRPLMRLSYFHPLSIHTVGQTERAQNIQTEAKKSSHKKSTRIKNETQKPSSSNTHKAKQTEKKLSSPLAKKKQFNFLTSDIAAGVLKYFVTIDIYTFESSPFFPCRYVCVCVCTVCECFISQNGQTTTPGVIGYEQYNSEKAIKYIVLQSFRIIYMCIWIIHFSQCWWVSRWWLIFFFAAAIRPCARPAGYYLLSESVIFKGKKNVKENLWCDELRM